MAASCSNSSSTETMMMETKVYKQRWLVVASLSILVFSNSMSRLAFGPVAYTSAVFYESEISVINWFAIIYMAVGIPFGVVATWIMEKIGLRYSIVISSCAHLLGCGLRVLSAISALPPVWKLILVFLGHFLSAASQPFMMFAPTKVAAVWFADNQRALANTIVTTCNPLGILAANILSPLLVRHPEDILMMLLIYLIPAALGVILTLIGVRTDAPKLPPSVGAQKTCQPFWIGIKQLATNGQYWILVLCIGGGQGMYTALTVLLEQILCPRNYSNIFIGVVCGSGLVVAGVFGALIASKIADRTKRFELVAKITYVPCVGAFAAFVFLQNRQNLHAVIALCCALIGFFGLPLLPLGNELVVETTYSADPATSSGLLFLAGQLQGMLLIVVLQQVAQPFPPDFLTNSTSCISASAEEYLENTSSSVVIRDKTVSCYVLLGYAVFVCLIFIVFFKSPNLRIKDEKRFNAENNPEKT